jgi:CHAT domain-containing protein
VIAIAGCKTLVMSLWKVPARASILGRFFDNLDLGMGRLDALAEAQNYVRSVPLKELRETAIGQEIIAEFSQDDTLRPILDHCGEGDPLLWHPVFWGAWVGQGERTPMQRSVKFKGDEVKEEPIGITE